MKKILAIFDFCETIVDRQSISPFLELARKANSAYRSPSSYKQRLLRKGARIIYKALLSGDSALLKKHRLSPTASLVLGSHSADLESSSRADEHLFPSSRADEVGVAIHKGAKADSGTKMDCHAAATAASRNDRNLSEPAKDSRIFNKNAQNVKTPQAAGFAEAGFFSKSAAKPTPKPSDSDSKILELESGLCKASAEIRLGRLSHKRAEAIADSSPKAESLQAKLARIVTPPTYPELAGLPLSTALSLAHSYALSLRTHINQKVLDRLLWHKAQGHTIVVVSGGLGIYIRPFMQQFGIDTILAVELESTFDKQGQEILSGNRSGLHTMQERKLYALDDRLDLARYDLPNSYAYSDCPSDVPLLSLVGKPCVVQGSQETRWARILEYPILVP